MAGIFITLLPNFHDTRGGGSVHQNLAEIDPCANELCRCKKKIHDDKTHNKTAQQNQPQQNDQDKKKEQTWRPQM